MSKESSKKLFEWYAQVAEKKLQAIKQGTETYKDCKTREHFSNYMLNVFIAYYGLRCTCSDGMDWDFNQARGHYHNCDLYKFCHIVGRSLDWAEHQNNGCDGGKQTSVLEHATAERRAVIPSSREETKVFNSLPQEPKQESILAEAVRVYEQAIEEAKIIASSEGKRGE